MSTKGGIMIVLLFGENTFLKQQEIMRLKADAKSTAMHYDGETMSRETWQQLVREQSLFGGQQLIVIDDLSKNTLLWDDVATDTPFNDTVVVLSETKVDKRTKTYKWLQKKAKVVECAPMKERDTRQAAQWLQRYAEDQKVKLSPELIDEMIRRATRQSTVDDRSAIIDQELLVSVIKQLSSSDVISLDTLGAVLAPSNHDNIFELFATALQGDGQQVHEAITRLSAEQDGYLAMGLLASQAQQLAGLVLGNDRDIDTIAHELGVHPYSLRQLSRYATTVSPEKLSHIVLVLSEADSRVKTGKAEPWLAIENALQSVSAAVKGGAV
jgi:DNA polymerase III delta subunit